MKRLAKDPNSDGGPYDILPAAFTNIVVPDIFRDVFIYSNVIYLNYRSAVSSNEEEAVLDGIFPGVMLMNKIDEKFIPLELSSYSTTSTTTSIVNGSGWANWRYFYNYERVVMESLTMHPSMLDYCKTNYPFVYDSSFYTMGIFANFVNKDGKIVSHKPPVNPMFCAKVIRSLYEENSKIKRVVVLVFTQDDSVAREYYKQLFSVEGVHPVFVKENPYIILQLCRAIKFIIPDSGKMAWWSAYGCSYYGGSVYVPYGYHADRIHPSWRVI
jgi:hypothetical protein